MTVSRAAYESAMRQAAAQQAALVASGGGAEGADAGGAWGQVRGRRVWRAEMLHTMAAGDFMLMSASRWLVPGALPPLHCHGLALQAHTPLPPHRQAYRLPLHPTYPPTAA